MTRRVLTLVGLTALAIVFWCRADETPRPAKAPTAHADESALNQEILARQFRDFKQALLRLAQRLGPQATVATIIVDSGLRYLSTDVFRT